MVTRTTPLSAVLCRLSPTGDGTVRTCIDPAGASRTAILSLAQDAAGYLWIGTEDGPVRFDGAAWDQPAGLAARRGTIPWAFDAAAPGRLWIGSDSGGVHLYETGAPPYQLRQSLTSAHGLADDDIHVLCRDAAGALWVGTHHGLAVVEDERVVATFTAAEGIPDAGICALCCDRDGRIWAGSLHGLLVFERGALVARYTSADGLPDEAVYALAVAPDGGVWAGTRHGVAVLRPGAAPIVIADGLPSLEVRALCFDGRGRAWVGTAKGLARCDGDRVVRRWTRGDGLPSSSVWSLHHDAEDRVWVGTDAGLAMLSAGRVAARSVEPKALLEGGASAFVVDQRGRVWAGTAHGLAALDPRTGAATPCAGLPRPSREAGVWALCHDDAGRLWAGGRYGGLVCLDLDQDAVSARIAEVEAVLCLLSDPDGLLWAGTNGTGLYAIDPHAHAVTRHVTVEHGLPAAHLSSLCLDAVGQLWVATLGGGLACLDRHSGMIVRQVGVEQGLPSAAVSGLARGADGLLWCATHAGLARLDPRSGAVSGVWSATEGLPVAALHSCAVDSSGAVWLGSARGLARLRPESGDCVVLGRAQGLASDYCQQGALLVDGAQHIWVGTGDGVSVVASEAVPESVAPCRVHLTDLWVMGQQRPITAQLEIDEAEYDLLFEFGAVEYVAPERVLYRTQLAGLEPEWSEPYAHRFARYTNLRPGEYTFRVSARNWGGAWSRPAELRIAVRPDPARAALEEALEQRRVEAEVQRATAQRLAELNKLLVATQLMQTALYEQLRRQKEVLERQAREDGLTGLLTRRAVDDQLAAEHRRSARRRRPLAVALADLDLFKAINDTFSHQVGDAVLKTVARLCQAHLRAEDSVGRYGGEEIALVLPDTTLDEALLVCERLRAVVASHDWEALAPGLRVTLSLGISSYHAGLDVAGMLAEADAYLYQAKRAGRNQTCCALMRSEDQPWVSHR